MDSTAAKIGRSMKNREKRMIDSGRSATAVRVGRVGSMGVTVGGDLHPRPDALQAVDDDLVARLEARADDPEAVDDAAELDRAVLDGAVGLEHQHELLVLVGADGARRAPACRVLPAADQLDAGEEARGERGGPCW